MPNQTRTRARLNQIYAEHTGQSVEVIEEAMERDRFMTPAEAKEFGIIDAVVARHDVPEDKDDGGKSGGAAKS